MNWLHTLLKDMFWHVSKLVARPFLDHFCYKTIVVYYDSDFFTVWPKWKSNFCVQSAQNTINPLLFACFLHGLLWYKKTSWSRFMWFQNIVVSLHNVFKSISWAKPIWGSIIFWIMGSIQWTKTMNQYNDPIQGISTMTVSYTHLTLPTNREV